jgi:hypothetical protein
MKMEACVPVDVLMNNLVYKLILRCLKPTVV